MLLRIFLYIIGAGIFVYYLDDVLEWLFDKIIGNEKKEEGKHKR